MAPQLLNSLGSGLVIVRQLLPGGDRVGAGPVRQAALRGALVPGALLLPVQVMLHQELQLLGGVQVGERGERRKHQKRKKNQRFKTFRGFKWKEKNGNRSMEGEMGGVEGKGWKSLGRWRENKAGGEGESEGRGGVIWREPMGEKWCDERFGFDETVAEKERSR